MEASDTFAAGIEAPADDPFAETSMSEFEQSTDPLAEDGALPVVDKEGNEVPMETPEEQELRERAEAELAGTRESAADPSPAPTDGGQDASSAAPTESEQPVAEPDPTAAAATSIAADAGAAGAGEEDPMQAASEAADPASSTPTTADSQSPAAPDAAAPAQSPGDGGPSGATATEELVEAGVAPVPEELKDKSGAITHRRYVLLTPEGNGKHREVTWHVDKGGKMVKKGTNGARKQSVCLARGQEEALAIGYNAMGSPENGVPLRAVALTYWGEITHVEPDPEPPIRQRLNFRR